MVVGISWLVASDQYGTRAIFSQSAAWDGGAGAGASTSASLPGTVYEPEGMCWVSGGVLTWGLLVPLIVAALISTYSTVHSLNFLRHDADLIKRLLEKNGLASVGEAGSMFDPLTTPGTGSLAKWESARDFEMLRRRANHLLLQLQAGHHRLRTNLVLWTLASSSWIFASASNAATTRNEAVLYELIYVLLTCLLGAAMLGMAMLDPQRDRNVIIMLFPPNQSVLDVLHLKSDLGTHLPKSKTELQVQHAASDVVWGGGGSLDANAATPAPAPSRGAARSAIEITVETDDSNTNAGETAAADASFTTFGAMRPATPRTAEGLRNRMGKSAIKSGFVQSLVKKFTILEETANEVSQPSPSPPRSPTRSRKSFGSAFGASMPASSVGASASLHFGGNEGSAAYMSNASGLISRNHSYESVVSVAPSVGYSNPADSLLQRQASRASGTSNSKTAAEEASKAAELIAGAAKRRQSDVAAAKAAEAEELLEAVRLAQDLLASRTGGMAGGSGSGSTGNPPLGSIEAELNSFQAANTAAPLHNGNATDPRRSSFGAADEAALLIGESSASSPGKGVSPARKRFQDGINGSASSVAGAGNDEAVPATPPRPDNPTAMTLFNKNSPNEDAARPGAPAASNAVSAASPPPPQQQQQHERDQNPRLQRGSSQFAMDQIMTDLSAMVAEGAPSSQGDLAAPSNGAAPPSPKRRPLAPGHAALKEKLRAQQSGPPKMHRPTLYVGEPT